MKLPLPKKIQGAYPWGTETFTQRWRCSGKRSVPSMHWRAKTKPSSNLVLESPILKAGPWWWKVQGSFSEGVVYISCRRAQQIQKQKFPLLEKSVVVPENIHRETSPCATTTTESLISWIIKWYIQRLFSTSQYRSATTPREFRCYIRCRFELLLLPFRWCSETRGSLESVDHERKRGPVPPPCPHKFQNAVLNGCLY